MRSYSRRHLSHPALLQSARTHVGEERLATAELLADLAEIEERRLFAAAGYHSMHAWCVAELGLSEDAACDRIHVAGVAREHPVIFSMVADGRLTLTAIRRLAPYLVQGAALDLLEAAAGQSVAQVQLLLARRFPRTEELAMVEALPAVSNGVQAKLAALRLGAGANGSTASLGVQSDRTSSVSKRINLPPSLEPIAEGRFRITLCCSQKTHDRLAYAAQLLAHQVPPGDFASLIDHLLDLAIPRLEKSKFGAAERRRNGGTSANGDDHRSATRDIPDVVKHAVWERDGAQCTFVGEGGRRCEARSMLEFDHVEPYANGGGATVSNLRLRCRTHNQYGAEQTFGAEFMRRRREEARLAREELRLGREQERARRDAEREAEHRRREEERTRLAAGRAVEEARARLDEDPDRSAVPWLQALGFSLEDARRADEDCDRTCPDAPMEQRVRVALRFLHALRHRAPASVSADHRSGGRESGAAMSPRGGASAAAAVVTANDPAPCPC